MRNKLLLAITVMFMGMYSQAQVTGTFTIPGTEYPTIASAIAALNAQGVGRNGVVFNISAGYVEQFPASSAGILTTTTSDASKQIVFQKSGTGANPLVIAGPGVSTATPMDAVFALGGTDYVTFDGISIKDAPTNTSSLTRMETGFWLARAKETDGCQHTTIRNCKIYGFMRNYVIASTNQNLAGTTVNATSFSGTNSYIKIYSDSIVNTTASPQTLQQIYFIGPANATTTGLFDYGNEIGIYESEAKASEVGGNVFLNTIQVNCSNTQWLRVAGNRFTTLDNTINGGAITLSNSKSPQVYNNDIGDFTVQGTGSITMISDQNNYDDFQYGIDIGCF